MKYSIQRYAYAIALMLSLLFFLQAFLGQRKISLTWDEPSFISAGYMYLTRGDFQLNQGHPPLMQDLVALPLLFLDIHEPSGSDAEWREANNPTAALGRRFIYDSGNDVDRIATWARLPVVTLGAFLVFSLFMWGKSLYGTVPALLAALLAAGNPELLAHAKLATEDLGCSAFMFFAVWGFWRAVKSGRLSDWGLCGLLTGLALISKYTALLLVPIYLALGGYSWFRHRMVIHPLALARTVAIVAGIAVAVVGAGYNFSFDLSTYFDGLTRIYGDTAQEYQFYLFGHISEKPFWYYGLAAFIVKVPVLTMVLIGLASFRAWHDKEHREAMFFLLVPAMIVIAASFFDRQNLGLRRILPAFPFLLLFTAQVAVNITKQAKRAAVLGLFVFAALEAAPASPHHLSYFNFIAGGPENGPFFLDDSNIDWGQDLPALAAWQQSHPEATPLKLFYFGSAKPSSYHVEAVDFSFPEILHPQPGYYAVSVQNLVWFRKVWTQYGYDVDWLSKYKPVDKAGYSIYIYHFPESQYRPTGSRE
jgi:hypothetical protein